MEQHTKSGILDYFVMIVKWRTLFLKVALGSVLFSYIGIYFLIDEEYESVTTIVPSEDKSMGGLSSIMKNLGNLPIAGLKGNSMNAETDLYVTIIESRSMLEQIIQKFDLQKEYGQPSMEKAVKRLKETIHTMVTDENAFRITVRGSSPEQAVAITEYILENLNATIIQLNIQKSRNNRLFLEQRYHEVNNNLRLAEDSLQIYQQHSGMLEVREQTKMIVNAFTQIESEVLAKKLELSILENTYSSESPMVDNLRIQVKEYEKKLQAMKQGSDKGSVILALNSLPAKAKNYIRHYRDVEIYSAILEFLVPLYEQAKFEEQKNVPVLQVIDKPTRPEKKAYPPRTLFAAVIGFGCLLLTYFYVLLQEHGQWKDDPKVRYIAQNIFRWKRS